VVRTKAAPKARTIDDYLARLDDDKRAALERLRRIIRAAAPRAEECISYGMPALRLDGRMLVWFGAGANHCAFYPGGIVEAYKDDLKDYETSKGTIRFRPDDPLPPALVKKIVKGAIARNAAATERRAASRTARGRR
jgi:uncharacterized protein YdhG (YjbR/CyaY superfamily)